MMSDKLLEFLTSKRDNPAVGLILGSAMGLHPALTLGTRAYMRFKARNGKKLPRPVISVGNITVGGTGKTSVVRLLLERLEESGLKVALLYRGYRRKSAGPVVLKPGGGRPLDPRLYGDEPCMVSRWSEDCGIFINENRYEAGLAAMETYSPDVFILDDGLQHVSLARDLEITLVDCTNPFDNGRLLPFGMLREPLSALKRAHLIVLTRCGQSDLADSIESVISGINPTTPIVRTTPEPYSILSIRGEESEAEELNGRSVYLFSGIGNHASFVMTALESEASVKGHVSFPDHHWYSVREMERLAEECRASGAEWLLTTEKDLVRIPRMKLGLPLYALTIKISILSGADSLWSKLTGIGVRPSNFNIEY